MQYMTVPSVALRLGVSTRLMRRLVAEKQIGSVLIGSCRRIPDYALAEFTGVDHVEPEGAPEWLSVNAAADALEVSRPTIYGLLSAGDLTSITVGGRRLISAASIAGLVVVAS